MRSCIEQHCVKHIGPNLLCCRFGRLIKDEFFQPSFVVREPASNEEGEVEDEGELLKEKEEADTDPTSNEDDEVDPEHQEQDYEHEYEVDQEQDYELFSEFPWFLSDAEEAEDAWNTYEDPAEMIVDENVIR